MEKIKEFLKSPKKTAILGLIGGILTVIALMVYSSYPIMILSFSLNHLYSIGLIIYFIIIITRMFKNKGNVKFANYIIIILCVAQLALSIVSIISDCTMIGLIYAVSLLITTLYFCNILLRKKNFVNNKIFATVMILSTLIQIVNRISYPYVVIQGIGQLLIIPYFYNYYELLKEENKNGK